MKAQTLSIAARCAVVFVELYDTCPPLRAKIRRIFTPELYALLEEYELNISAEKARVFDETLTAISELQAKLRDLSALRFLYSAEERERAEDERAELAQAAMEELTAQIASCVKTNKSAIIGGSGVRSSQRHVLRTVPRLRI